jgi:hypothetical protein
MCTLNFFNYFGYGCHNLQSPEDLSPPEIESSLKLDHSDSAGYGGSASVTTKGGYRVQITQPKNPGDDAQIEVFGPDGKSLGKIWGDPHVQGGDGKSNTFKGNLDMQLPDGSHVLVETEPDPNHQGAFRIKGAGVVDQNHMTSFSNIEGGGDITASNSKGGNVAEQFFHAFSSHNNLALGPDGDIKDQATGQSIGDEAAMDQATPSGFFAWNGWNGWNGAMGQPENGSSDCGAMGQPENGFFNLNGAMGQLEEVSKIEQEIGELEQEISGLEGQFASPQSGQSGGEDPLCFGLLGNF